MGSNPTSSLPQILLLFRTLYIIKIMEQKQCTKCHSITSVENFRLRSTGKRESHCIPCKREDIRDHYKKNKEPYNERSKKQRLAIAKFISDLKDNKPCMDCGICYHYWVMQYDHRDKKTKKASISFFKGKLRTISVILEEIDKCDLVCANCHADRTYKRKDWERSTAILV